MASKKNPKKKTETVIVAPDDEGLTPSDPADAEQGSVVPPPEGEEADQSSESATRDAGLGDPGVR